MQVDLRILRFDPERDSAPHWERYTVESQPMDRVLSLLHLVKAEIDETLTFRRSCGHGICGSDAMLINGRNRLACKIRVDQLGKKITVAPLNGLPVVKDLVVDMDGFFGKYRSALPFLVKGEYLWISMQILIAVIGAVGSLDELGAGAEGHIGLEDAIRVVDEADERLAARVLLVPGDVH